MKSAKQIIARLRHAGYTVRLQNGSLSITGAKLSVKQKAFLQENNAALKEELMRENEPIETNYVYEYTLTDQPDSIITMISQHRTLDAAKAALVMRYGKDRLIDVKAPILNKALLGY